MRVAILIRKWSVRGGNERAAVDLSRVLEARGHEVTVVCQRADDSAPPPPRIEQLTSRLAFDPSLAMISFARAARRKLKAMRAAGAIDVSIGFNHTVLQDVYRLGGGMHAEALAEGVRAGPVVDRAALRLEKVRFREGAYARIVAPSERTKQELLAHYPVDPERVVVVWNGVDLSRFRPEPAEAGEREAVRRAWGVGSDERVLLFVGQDLARKGFDRALEVARALGLRLVYAGKAPRPKDLDPLVIWTGETRSIERLYRSAEALLAPSRYDPFGGVVLEALASGLPAVAARRIGATERGYGTALDPLFIEDAGDIAKLCDAVRHALDPQERPKLIRAALACTKDATLEAWGGRIEAILERVREARP